MALEIEKIIGPFETNERLGLLAITDNYLYLIKLNSSATFKYSISQQIPFLYSNYFDKLISKPLDDIITLFDSDKLRIDEKLKVKIEKSKLWKHSIRINSGQLDVKWNILERGLVDEYEKLLSKKLGDKYISD